MAAINKIAATSPSRQSPSELETSIAGALYDLETNNSDIKSALRPLQFVSAREVGQFQRTPNIPGGAGVHFVSLADGFMTWCTPEEIAAWLPISVLSMLTIGSESD
jgi:Ribosomal protein S7e